MRYLLVLIDKVVNDLSPAVRQVDHVLAWIKYKLNTIKYQSGRWTTYWPDKDVYSSILGNKVLHILDEVSYTLVWNKCHPYCGNIYLYMEGLQN